MRFGVHLSISRGLLAVIEEARKRECETIQIFIQSPRSWTASVFKAEEISAFRHRLKKERIAPLVIHAPYLVNVVSSNFSLRLKSALSLVEHLKAGKVLGASFLVFHPGSNFSLSHRAYKKFLLESLDFIFSRTANESPLLLLENMAQKESYSHSLVSLIEIIRESGYSSRLGICLDTAHAFAAGYDLSSAAGWEKVLTELEENQGLNYLKLIHANDSYYPLGSGRDKHADLGKGRIGKSGFFYLVSEPRLADIPCILETPKMSLNDDLRNLLFIRSLGEKIETRERKEERKPN